MFLPFDDRLGFETLCGKLADSLLQRRFGRIGLADPVAEPPTLIPKASSP